MTAVYDAFIFFNELELLELRLAELDSAVHRFVLVESDRTHAGDEKPLTFAENRDMFRPFLHKIIHVVVGDMPGGDDAWARENHQRNAIVRGLGDCRPDDLVLISDLDEIPDKATVQELRSQPDRLAVAAVFEQLMFYYSFAHQKRGPWCGTIAVRHRDLASTSPQALRNAREQLPRVARGGWHLSYFGGPQRIAAKIRAFAHTEANTEFFRDPDRIASCISAGEDLFHRTSQSEQLISASLEDHQLPGVVARNKGKYFWMF
jgi:hypothetical protein